MEAISEWAHKWVELDAAADRLADKDDIPARVRRRA